MTHSISIYETVKPIIDKRELPTSAGTLSGDELDKQLLIDRYIISAPLFELKANTAIHKDYFLGSDIKLKEKVMDDLYVISKQISNKTGRHPKKKRKRHDYAPFMQQPWYVCCAIIIVPT